MIMNLTQSRKVHVSTLSNHNGTGTLLEGMINLAPPKPPPTRMYLYGVPNQSLSPMINLAPPKPPPTRMYLHGVCGGEFVDHSYRSAPYQSLSPMINLAPPKPPPTRMYLYGVCGGEFVDHSYRSAPKCLSPMMMTFAV